MAGAAKGNYWFITVAALNMIVSLYYYLRVVRLVFSAPDGGQMEGVKVLRPVGLGLAICSAGVVLAGVISWIYDHISSMTM
jgi:NADH-quinone oxidoreductase subunit N